MENIGLLVKKHRILNGLSSQAMATRLGVSRQTLFHWERGVVQPTRKHLLTLKAELGVSATAPGAMLTQHVFSERELVEKFKRVNSIRKLEKTLLAVLGEIGITKVFFVLTCRGDLRDIPPAVVISTVDADWVDRYERKRYARIDPTWKYSADEVLPVTSKTFCEQAVASKNRKVLAFFSDFAQHGYAFSRIIPIHSAEFVGFFSVSVMADKGTVKSPLEAISQEVFLAPYNLFLSYLATIVQDCATRLLNRLQRPADIFSEKEIRTVMLLARGYTINAIAKELNVSVAAINTRLTKIKQKLSVSTREQLVYEVAARGLFNLRSDAVQWRRINDSSFQEKWQF